MESLLILLLPKNNTCNKKSMKKGKIQLTLWLTLWQPSPLILAGAFHVMKIMIHSNKWALSLWLTITGTAFNTASSAPLEQCPGWLWILKFLCCHKRLLQKCSLVALLLSIPAQDLLVTFPTLVLCTRIMLSLSFCFSSMKRGSEKAFLFCFKVNIL